MIVTIYNLRFLFRRMCRRIVFVSTVLLFCCFAVAASTALPLFVHVVIKKVKQHNHPIPMFAVVIEKRSSVRYQVHCDEIIDVGGEGIGGRV